MTIPRARVASKDQQGNRTSLIVAVLGVVAALLGLAAPVVTILLGRIDGLRGQVQDQQSTIGQQQQKITHLKTAQTAVPDAPEGGSYLSNENPVTNLASASAGPVVIGGVTYPDSVSFGCNGPVGSGAADVIYKVTGTALTAVVGLSDNAGSGTGVQDVAETVTFADQAGRIVGDRVTVTAGKPLRVHIPLSGVSQLALTCVPVDTATGQRPGIAPPVSLANAATS